ncbi:MAG: hypothetical protein KAH03_00430 [Cocleimonas sp.]|nr:hypothetical protein [Cocleimonas sp.]
MDISLVTDILNTGVTGFAFLMLYLGFKLTSNVQAKIFEHKPGDFKSIEMYREWKGLIASQLTNTRYFLAFSLLFFAGGLFLLLYQAENRITVETSPEKLPFSPRVFFQSKPMDLSNDNSLLVKDGQNIRVSYDEPVAKIQALNALLEHQKNLAKALMIEKASRSDDVGF